MQPSQEQACASPRLDDPRFVVGGMRRWQVAKEILKKYTNYLKKITPKGIDIKVKVWSKGPACVVGTDNRYVKALGLEALALSFLMQPARDFLQVRRGGGFAAQAQGVVGRKVPLGTPTTPAVATPEGQPAEP